MPLHRVAARRAFTGLVNLLAIPTQLHSYVPFFKSSRKCVARLLARDMPPLSGKTILKMCSFYERGCCQRDVWCTFAHCPEELGQSWTDRPRLHRATLCKFFERQGHGY